jgi:predicted nucleotide-binding protein
MPPGSEKVRYWGKTGSPRTVKSTRVTHFRRGHSRTAAHNCDQPIIAQEHETIAKPVPEKVMDDMRACSAAVIHVSSEGTYKDASGKERTKINDNVLIEIGAAMALYKRNFILVVEDGFELPSNLQGLYQCRYTGDELGMEATMKLLKAFKEFRE